MPSIEGVLKDLCRHYFTSSHFPRLRLYSRRIFRFRLDRPEGDDFCQLRRRRFGDWRVIAGARP